MTSAAEVVSIDTRRPTLGGSTLPAACGIDPWCSPIRLWLEMTGRIERPESDAMTWGKRLQGPIFDALDELGYLVNDAYDQEWRDPARPWLVGHPDGLGYEAHEGLLVEVKAVGKWSPSANGGPQPNYEAQVQTYLHLTGLDDGLLAVLVGGQKLELHELERNQRAIDTLLELGERFMDYVRRDSPPPAAGHSDDRAALADAFPQHERGKVVRASRELAADVRLLARVKEQAKAVKAREATIAARITEAMGDAETMIGLHDEPLATWRTVASRRVNTDRLRADYPQVYEAVADSTSTRRLTLA